MMDAIPDSILANRGCLPNFVQPGRQPPGMKSPPTAEDHHSCVGGVGYCEVINRRRGLDTK